jgi:uridine kinase
LVAIADPSPHPATNRTVQRSYIAPVQVPRFASVPTPTEDNRLSTLRSDLTQLKADPNVDRIQVEAIVDSVGQYLQRREHSGNEAFPFMVGYGGPSAGGKSTNCISAARLLTEHFARIGRPLPGEARQVASHVNMDGFYKDKSEAKAHLGMDRYLAEWDLDTPDSWNMHTLQHTVKQVQQSQPVIIDSYDYGLGKVTPGQDFLSQSLVYLFEGNHMLSDQDFNSSGQALQDMLDLKVYVHTANEALDKRWRERLETIRDLGVSPWAVEAFFKNVVKARTDFVEGTRQNAHLVLNTGNGEDTMIHTLNTLTSALMKALHGETGALNLVA